MLLCFFVFMNLHMEKLDRDCKLSVKYLVFDVCLDEAIALSANKREHCLNISKSRGFLPFLQQCLYCLFPIDIRH